MKSIYDYTDYRTYLKDYLTLCQNRNGSFSLRSYAKKLCLNPSYLSEVLSGKKNLSLAKASVFAPKLGLNAQEQQYLMDLIQAQDSRNKGAMNLIQDRVKNTYRPNKRSKAQSGQFDVLSLWYTIPVLEMITNSSYGDSDEQIGRVLGVSSLKVREAIDQLEQLQIIAKDSSNHWIRTSNDLILSSESHHQALKKFHLSLIEKYQRALFDQSPQERYTGSETLMIDPRQIPEANKIMNECLDRLLTLFSSGDLRTEPYHVHFAMFSLRRKIIISQGEAS